MDNRGRTQGHDMGTFGHRGQSVIVLAASGVQVGVSPESDG